MKITSISTITKGRVYIPSRVLKECDLKEEDNVLVIANKNSKEIIIKKIDVNKINIEKLEEL